ncbi:hypothetical protein ATO10_12159 [Actibacterium atlanticum]|uniref:Sulfotransferase family protein n=1 Tax=Actibacterium atlanticum TaxID=1461693 RepID=A0A058ZIB9_9RHOB|nr:sulfotransferase family protein [Actibacterium atlanticum]KCV81359.1 hypothetical protein ATO10_12159 [Actibacterium atlanticum]
MSHVIVHAGFHKTGTTSLQQCLRAYHKQLSPHVGLYYGAKLGPVQHRGRHYGYEPTEEMLGRFRRGLRRFLKSVPDQPQIVLSREAFCGALLGETRTDGTRITSYAPTSVPLAKALVNGIQERFGQDVQITFLFTTRENDSMIASAHRHLLRLRRMTDDLETFSASLAFDKDTELAALRNALGPIPLVEAPLSEYGPKPAGPAAAVLDLLTLPDALRASITWEKRNRPGQSADLSDELLALNRSISDDEALKMIKEKLLLEREGIRPD